MEEYQRGSKLTKIKEEQDCIIEQILSIDGKISTRRYIKQGLLGTGGFANCFQVISPETKKKAAAKIIGKEVLTSYRTKLRIMNEIQLHKTLHHPHIVEFYHYFEDKSNVYFFLELCQNQSLNELIKVRNCFTTPQIQVFIYGLIQGLMYLHSKNIIHRDIKLGNLFVDGRLNVKIGDFGLATKLQFPSEFKRTICGTPNYIAPQILQGKGYHFEVDIWSIGVIMYALYVGCPPFQTEQASQTYKKIRNIDFEPPTKNQGVPQQAIQLIMSILVKNPVQRPTLQQILDSDFMKMGKGIFSSLPKVCATKAPSKKQLFENSFINIKSQPVKKHCHARQNSQNMKLIKKSSENSNKPSQFVIKVQYFAQNNSYMYELNDNSKAVLTKDNCILYRNKDNKIVKFNIKNETVQTEVTLLSEQNKILTNFTQQSSQKDKISKTQGQKPNIIYVQKITYYKNFFMIRLSNSTLEILFDTKDGFYISKPEELFYFDIKGKVQQLKINDVLQDNFETLKKFDQQKIRYLKGIIIEKRSRKVKKRQFRQSM